MANDQFVGALEFDGPAVERDAAVLDKNEGGKWEEAAWIAKMREVAPDFSKSHVAFFEELRQRQE
jgi:hypothetical protein